ncbi:hypothetical protein ACOSP7_022152 [Xanthoceras sorbifolium]
MGDLRLGSMQRANQPVNLGRKLISEMTKKMKGSVSQHVAGRGDGDDVGGWSNLQSEEGNGGVCQGVTDPNCRAVGSEVVSFQDMGNNVENINNTGREVIPIVGRDIKGPDDGLLFGPGSGLVDVAVLNGSAVSLSSSLQGEGEALGSSPMEGLDLDPCPSTLTAKKWKKLARGTHRKMLGPSSPI